MMPDTRFEFDGWEPIEELGRGGQGTVYKARKPERVEERKTFLTRVHEILRENTLLTPYDPKLAELASRIVECGSLDKIEHLGALKKFEIPSKNRQEADKALARLESEIRALGLLKERGDAAILKLLHAKISREYFIVTEYHSNGTLAQRLRVYQGKPLEALLALRPLVSAVASIHKSGAIHRDIKPANIFIGDDGHLVLGDFGIVFFADLEHTRQTEYYGERVGSHEWMAPWVYAAERVPIEEIDPKLDIFPLGKVLWCMVSGRPTLPFWEYKDSKNDLEQIFPDNTGMRIINGLLSRCVVRRPEDCLASAEEFLTLIDSAIDDLRHSGERPQDEKSWPCRSCGRGRYIEDPQWLHMSFGEARDRTGGAYHFRTYICDKCKHAQLFRD